MEFTAKIATFWSCTEGHIHVLLEGGHPMPIHLCLSDEDGLFEAIEELANNGVVLRCRAKLIFKGITAPLEVEELEMTNRDEGEYEILAHLKQSPGEEIH